MKVKKAAARKPAARKAPVRKVVKPIPDGYHALTAYLCVDGAAAAIDFYKKAFGARERMRMGAPGGKVGHAEIVIGDSALMLADEFPEMDFHAPQPGARISTNIHLYVKNVDKVFARAVAAGAKVLRPLENKFYGDRIATLSDPFGHVWHISTHVEDLSTKELKQRGEAMAKEGSGG